MGFETVHFRQERDHALVRVDDLQFGRLSDDRHLRQRKVMAKTVDRIHDAKACRLLVIRKHDVDRRLEIGGQELGNERQHDCHEGFHIHRTTTEGLAIGHPQCARIRSPVLSFHRHHVGVARENDAAAI